MFIGRCALNHTIIAKFGNKKISGFGVIQLRQMSKSRLMLYCLRKTCYQRTTPMSLGSINLNFLRLYRSIEEVIANLRKHPVDLPAFYILQHFGEYLQYGICE